MEKKKGFTLVELLVVIAIIALLMGILMPALARVRQLAYRMVSGTNQAGIGKAMVIYANDNDADYPVAGSRRPIYAQAGQITSWYAATRLLAYGYTLQNISTVNTNITIGSCFYLLIKYADVAPKQFVNKSDVGCKEFRLSDYTNGSALEDITDAWDFGETSQGGPATHVSYSYHAPFVYGQFTYPITQQSNPSAPVVADRNPYLDTNATTYLNISTIPPALPSWSTTPARCTDTDGKMNAACHQLDGQNVLFNDIHVKFEKMSNCGINNDNIYTSWLAAAPTAQVKQMGTWPGSVPTYTNLATGAARPWSVDDAFLLSDRTN